MEIVESDRGRIWAETLEAGGARFSFTLPKAEPAPELQTAGGPSHRGQD